MVVLKLLMELGALVFLALFLRRIFINNAEFQSDSESSVVQGRLRGEWQWYSIIYLALGLILSFISFWLIYGAFNILHNIGQYSGVLVVNQGALFVPSLIFGFGGSSIFSKSVYLDLFGMNGAIFKEDRMGIKQRIFTRVFGAFVLSIAVFLLTLQFKVYMKTDGDKIYVGKLGGKEMVYNVEDIKKVASRNSHSMDIYLKDGDKLSTSSYSGNFNYFFDNISK